MNSEFILYNGRVIGPSELHKITNEDYLRVAQRFKEGKRLTYDRIRKIVTVEDIESGNTLNVHVGKAHTISRSGTRRNKRHNKTLRLRTAKFEAVGPEKPKSTTGRMTKTAQKARNTAVAVLVKESRGKTAAEIRGLIAATVGMHINADSRKRVEAAAANATAAASTAANTGAAGGAGAGAGASSMPKGFVMHESKLGNAIRKAVGKVKPDALSALLEDITRQLGSTTLSTRD